LYLYMIIKTNSFSFSISNYSRHGGNRFLLKYRSIIFIFSATSAFTRKLYQNV
jgi:hypothetical protein